MKNFFIIPFRAFSKKTPYDIKVERIKNLTSKARMKETVADRKRLGEFLQADKIKNTIGASMQRSANENTDFKGFLQAFQEKHKEYPTLIDLSHYLKDWDNINKDPELRKEDLEMLNDFRRRKKLIKDNILNNVRIGKYSGIGEITAVGIFLVLAQLFLGQISKLLTFLEGDNNCISPSVASDNLGGLEVLVKDGAGGLAFFL